MASYSCLQGKRLQPGPRPACKKRAGILELHVQAFTSSTNIAKSAGAWVMYAVLVPHTHAQLRHRQIQQVHYPCAVGFTAANCYKLQFTLAGNYQHSFTGWENKETLSP
jgi:hypothetical protein